MCIKLRSKASAPRPGLFAFGGHLVFDDGFGDGEGNAVLVIFSLDESSFFSVREEAAFEKDGRVFDAGEEGVAGATDASIAAAGVFDDGGVDGGGEGDIGSVVVVAGLFAEVGSFEFETVMPATPLGAEGEGFDAVGTAATAGVEVEGDEDGVGVLVGEVDALFKGEEFVFAASEADLEAALAELGGEFFWRG